MTTPPERHMTPPTIIVFDGDCAVCNGWVGLLARVDRHAAFEFVPAQCPRGGRLLRAAGLAAQDLDTILVLEGERRLVRSNAILHAMTRLGGGWRVLAVVRIVPRPLRDLAYRLFARSRYRVFGRATACRISPPPT